VLDLTQIGKPTRTGPLQVLFVCTANICRSPFLELTARQLAGGSPDIIFASAGTQGFTDKAMDQVMSTTLPAGAADTFRSRALDRDILDWADLVLTAEAHHRSRILEEWPAAFRKVFTVGQFAASVGDHPDKSGRELVAAAGARRTAPLPEQDISDPYRLGEAAAQEAAGIMSTMLSVIVPRLLGSPS
jgi:sulfate adenylyltransferase